MRTRIIAAFTASLLAPLHVDPPGLAAQETIDLASIRPCEKCALRASAIVSFGDPSGSGIIEADPMVLVAHPTLRYYAAFRKGGKQVSIFDSTGRYVRTVGKPGSGPGEIQTLVDAQFVGQNLFTIDYTGSRLSKFDLSGRFITSTRMAVRIGPFRVVSDTSIAIASMDRQGPSVGFPLHMMAVRDGRSIRHFGSMGEYNAGDPTANDIVLGWSPQPGTIWRGKRGQLHLEEWSVNGVLLRSLTGDLPWLPAKRIEIPKGFPPSSVLTFGFDSQNRLWLVSRVPDAKWRQLKRQGSEGLIRHEDLPGYFDTRLDVYDINKRRHLGTLSFDDAWLDLVPMHGDFAFQRLTYQEDVPRITLFRVFL